MNRLSPLLSVVWACQRQAAAGQLGFFYSGFRCRSQRSNDTVFSTVRLPSAMPTKRKTAVLHSRPISSNEQHRVQPGVATVIAGRNLYP